MKKLLCLILLLSLLCCMLCSCFSTGGEDNQGNGTVSPSGSDSNLGDYKVTIDSCRMATDYKDKPIVIIKYTFTNNADDPASFYVTFDAEVFQDGIGLNRCYVVADSANYSEDNQTKEIKKGATLSVEVAYELNDTTTDIEVEVEEFFSFSGKKVTKTFSLS